MNSAQDISPFIFYKSFYSLEDFIETVQGWDLEFLQLDKGKFEGLLFQAQIGQIILGEAYFGRSFCQRGISPPNTRTFVIPVKDTSNFTWRKVPLTNNTISLFPKNGELYSVSKRGFHIFTISIPEELFNLYLLDLEFSDFFKELQEECVWKTDSVKIDILRKELFLAKNHILKKSKANYAELEYRIIKMLFSIVGEMKVISSVPSSVLRKKALNRALEFVHGNHENKFLTMDLVNYCDVSERTLQYAFKSEFGISPKEYITAVSLDKVRKNLKKLSEEKMKISAIANQFGFWHMGQFAKDYRAKFGELPSATLKK